MANFNKVLLIGRLTRDPQLSYTPSQTAVVDFGLAVNRNWTGRDGEKREETCFVDCRAFGRPAENINKYLSKGRQLLVEGRLTFNSWTAQDGTKRSKHRVTVENFQFIGRAIGEADAGTQVEGTPNAKERVWEGYNREMGPEPEEERRPVRDPTEQVSNGASADDIPF